METPIAQSTPQARPQEPMKGPSLIAVSLVLLSLAIVSVLGAAMALDQAAQSQTGRSVWALLMALGVLLAFGAAIAGLIGSIRWAAAGQESAELQRVAVQQQEAQALLKSINDRLLISDSAKRIAYRRQDREALRQAIREDIDKGDFDAAIVLVDEMSQTYGYREEAEQFREEIEAARRAEIEQKITRAIAELDLLIRDGQWDRAAIEAAKIQRLFPDSPRVRTLDRRVREAREERKRKLERDFLQASQRDEIDRAIDLLKELDKYLTEAEAEPFRETARGVIGKKRENLGVQFKMAVHDKEWTSAVRIGEQIIRDFPNTKMSEEVRKMIDVLRERAAGEQAARPRELAV